MKPVPYNPEIDRMRTIWELSSSIHEAIKEQFSSLAEGLQIGVRISESQDELWISTASCGQPLLPGIRVSDVMAEACSQILPFVKRIHILSPFAHISDEWITVWERVQVTPTSQHREFHLTPEYERVLNALNR